MASHVAHSSASVCPAPTKRPGLFWSILQGWNRFWFTPADPTVLGLIRLCCGLLVLYTTIAYTFDLQAFFGKDAWCSLELRRKSLDESPTIVPSLYDRNKPSTAEFAVAHTPEQTDYINRYQQKWGDLPPGPFPQSREEEEWIDEYRTYWGMDPRMAIAVGTPEWSIWFHVTDPANMMAVHALFILAIFLFTIGFCTRITSVLTWVASLCYIHRSPITLFGVDTMMLILLVYLMIGPSGSAISVDRWLWVWWLRHRERVILRWRRLLGQNTDLPAGSVRAADLAVPKTITANVAIRGLQIHLCFVYCAAGLAKLLGQAWWNGTAVWGTLANFEFAPMESDLYYNSLAWLAQHNLALQLFLAFGTYFTLFFEITYAFLIWRPSTRWLMLTMAIVLHGFIGMLMGLKTFALMMLVMNMIFLPPRSVQWLVNHFPWWRVQPESADTLEKTESKEPVRPDQPRTPQEVGSVGGSGLKRKQ